MSQMRSGPQQHVLMNVKLHTYQASGLLHAATEPRTKLKNW